jgi:hypothetical protein
LIVGSFYVQFVVPNFSQRAKTILTAFIVMANGAPIRCRSDFAADHDAADETWPNGFGHWPRFQLEAGSNILYFAHNFVSLHVRPQDFESVLVDLIDRITLRSFEAG